MSVKITKDGNFKNKYVKERDDKNEWITCIDPLKIV